MIAASNNRHYQGKDRPRLIVLSDCAARVRVNENSQLSSAKVLHIFYIRKKLSILLPICVLPRFLSFVIHYIILQFHALKTHANALRARTRTLVQPIIASTLLVNLNAKTPTYIRAEVNIKADVRTVAAMWIVRRHKINKPRTRACSLVSGMMTKVVTMFINSVHNLTNIFLYFRRKTHGCVRVRTRNYFLHSYKMYLHC